MTFQERTIIWLSQHIQINRDDENSLLRFILDYCFSHPQSVIARMLTTQQAMRILLDHLGLFHTPAPLSETNP